MLNLTYGTPVESHFIGTPHREVRVKRDDLASGAPAPRLGKLRGIAHAILASGAEVIGAVDRSPMSRNTWAHAYVCRELGLRFYGYCDTRRGYNQEQVQRLMKDGGNLVLTPGADLYERARRHFYESETLGWMAEDDCHSDFLINDAKDETIRTGRSELDCDTLILPVGSGGLAIGVLTGFHLLNLHPRVVLYMGASRRHPDYIRGAMDATHLSRHFAIELAGTNGHPIEEHHPPFPANITYEVPAWSWLVKNLSDLRRPLFWNAGA